MEIRNIDFKNEQETKEVIDVIYTSFISHNKKNSSERLIKKMGSLYGPGYDYEKTLTHLQESTTFLIAKEQGKVVGMIRGTDEKISNLYIHNDRHGKGIGKTLLQAFEAEAKKRGSVAITLKSSEYALPFYLKNGYIVTHEHRMIKYL